MDYEQILLDSGYSTLSARDHKDALEKALDKVLEKGKKVKEVEKKISIKDINEVVINESKTTDFKEVIGG